VAEALELGDESFGESFGVAFAKVVTAEVVVELAGAQHVPDDADDRVLDGARAFLWPRRGLSLAYWAAR